MIMMYVEYISLSQGLGYVGVSAHQSLLYFYLPRDPENIQVKLATKQTQTHRERLQYQVG